MRLVVTMSVGLAIASSIAAVENTRPAAAPHSPVATVALPGAPTDGVLLDYLAVDRGRHRVWVPAGGTGNVIVIDTASREFQRIEGFATKEVERRGAKRMVGPSSATIGDGFVYVGNRADQSVCAIDATTLARAGCVTLAGSPDGVAYVARTKEVWVTTPRDESLAILDVSTPSAPKLAGSIKLPGGPEGYAVDEVRGHFFTNLEDKDKTLRIDVKTRKITATWSPDCGEEGPRGLAFEPGGSMLMLACTDRVEVLDTGKDGRIVSKLETGAGVDNLDYVPASRLLYAAAGGAETLTVAHVDKRGVLQSVAKLATAKGARNAVASEDGTAFVADGPAGAILVVATVGKP